MIYLIEYKILKMIIHNIQHLNKNINTQQILYPNLNRESHQVK